VCCLRVFPEHGVFLHADTFWTNPQYSVEVIDPDEGDEDRNGTLIVAVMQKERRKKKLELGLDLLTIGYTVYKVNCYGLGTCYPCSRPVNVHGPCSRVVCTEPYTLRPL